MSVETQTIIICDGCGTIIAGPIEGRSTYLSHSYGVAKTAAEKQHWLFVSRGKYRTYKHFCQKCADGAPKPKQGQQVSLAGRAPIISPKTNESTVLGGGEGVPTRTPQPGA